MVFSSLPLYLDPPNWPPVQSNQDGLLNTDHNQNLSPQLPSGGSNGVYRPGSMAERARQAKIPQPEAALKCPRCESTNTKFCYFNNYNLSQPRHFCKTCRRYWTRGGALRNVPVGGGCRRNKRSKGNKNKSKPSDRGQTLSNSSYNCTGGHMSAVVPPPPPQLPLHNIGNQFISGGVGANYGGIGTNGLMEQWRMQQGQDCHFMSNNGLLYPFDVEGVEAPSYGGGQLRGSGGGAASVTQLGNLKLEGNEQGVNLSRNFLGLSGNYDLNHQIWGGNNAWTDFPGGFPASSSAAASHLL